jgi:hypothetical protein
MKFFLGLLFILFSSRTVYSSEFILPICTELKNSNSFLIQKGVSCETLKNFEDKFQIILKTINHPIPFPKVFVSLNAQEAWSTYGNLLHISQTQMAWGQVKTNSQRDMVWMHEIGHLVFQQMLESDFKKLSCFKKYMQQDANEKWKARNPFLNTDKALAQLWSTECSSARDLQVAYSEIFADFIVSLTLGDPRAPVKYMKSSAAPQTETAKVELYDFSKNHLVENCINEDPHFYFAPVRGAVGKKFLSGKSEKDEAVKEFYRVIKEDILSYGDNNKLLGDCKIASKQFIARIVQKTK